MTALPTPPSIDAGDDVMPLYEYYCRDCRTRFELLRPMSRMDDPAACPGGHGGSQRVLSTFAAVTKGEGGEYQPVAGAGGCAGCGGGSCGTCG